MEEIRAFFNTELGIATYSMLGLALLRTILGGYQAVADHTFLLSKVAATLGDQLLKRVFPVLTVFYFAAASGNGVLITAAAAAASLYVAESVGKVQELISPEKQAEVAAKIDLGKVVGNPVPDS